MQKSKHFFFNLKGKYSHLNNNDDPSDTTDSSSITTSINNTINSILNEKNIKQENLNFNSDGETSSISSENDSNSSCSSQNNDDLSHFSSLNGSQQHHQPTKLTHINLGGINSKKVIIATKLEPFSSNQTFQLQSNCNNGQQSQIMNGGSQINLIKITTSNGCNEANENKSGLITTAIGSKKADALNQNHKKIVQYKQLVNGVSLIKSTPVHKNKQISINNGENVTTNHNGVPLATRPDGKVSIFKIMK